MKRHNGLAGVITWLACMALSPSAQPAVMSTVSLGSLRAELTDLDLADGRAPSLSFSSRGLEDNLIYAEAIGAGSAYSDHFGSSLFEPAARGAVVGGVSAAASLRGRGAFEGSFMQAGGAALSPGSFYAGVLAPRAGERSNFTLSPNTRLVVSGLANAALQTSVGGSEWADVYVRLWLGGPGADGGSGFQGTTDEIHLLVGLDAAGQYGATGQADSVSDRLFSVSFANRTALPMDGNLEMFVAANGASAVLPAIPEPGTAWLLGAGLGVLAALRRRQSKPICPAARCSHRE